MGNGYKCLHVTDLRGRNGAPPFISLQVAGSVGRVMLCQECHIILSEDGAVLIRQYYNKPTHSVKRYPHAVEPVWFEVIIS